MTQPPDPAPAPYHSPGFGRLVDSIRPAVREMTIEEFRRRSEAGEPLVLVDIREDREWDAARIPGAVHVGRGVLERDVESAWPDPATPLVLQCGGGYRSVLSAESLQRMGYTHVWSLAEGFRGWRDRGLPLEGPR
jgi:rhodanese-related sulfurtransferase